MKKLTPYKKYSAALKRINASLKKHTIALEDVDDIFEALIEQEALTNARLLAYEKRIKKLEKENKALSARKKKAR